MTQTIQRASSGFTYEVSGTLEVHECPTCGVLHAVPTELVRYADRHRPCFPIYCPNGHRWGKGGKSWEKRLAEARDDAAVARAQRDQAEASAQAYRGAATRARNERDRVAKRVKAGVCPCCHRTFKQLARHMARQHPDYAEGEGAP